MLRLVIDARRSNLHLRPPLGVELCSAEARSRIEISAGDDLITDDDYRLGQVHVGKTDIKDCFYRMRMDPAMSEFFCLPALNRPSRGLSHSSSHCFPRRAVFKVSPDTTVLGALQIMHCDS